ncbi:response regulator transcription factor [Paenibacillus abyssi]|uniref:DNA-binding response regulator n=1 Tax=Paenibacillus abyssi TaxID=1340531 RepID=A0A917FN68_9BACL|nr:response regulator transcription factor [Paenibacillus abyssi]GGF90755.1 DNA-binding response regulator [Paenibacillus abyssi]
MKEQRILIVDDEEPMRELLMLYLKADGYTADAISNSEDVLLKMQQTSYDLVLLDVMMPIMDGFEVCRAIRASYTTPVIMITARERTIDKVEGLRIGADDYITKPFEQQELLARIESIFRRERFLQDDRQLKKPNQLLIYKGLTLNLATHRAMVHSKELALTPKEYAILKLFLSNKGRIFHRDDILELIWKTAYVNDDRTVDTHIKNLREKLSKAGLPGQEVIKTVWGTGYICHESS